MDAHEHPLVNKLLWWLVTSPIFVRCQILITRKIAKLFGWIHGIQPFYTACFFNDLSRGFISCLLKDSFETAISHITTCFPPPKIDDHGVGWGNTGQTHGQWRHLMASRIPLDLPAWAMCSIPYHLIRMAIKMAHNGGACVCHCWLFVLHNHSKTAMIWPIKNKSKL